MVAAAVGMQRRGWRPFASTFAAFLTRATTSCGWSPSVAATSAWSLPRRRVDRARRPLADGASRTSRRCAVHGSTVLYPCAANQTVQLLPAMADRGGICYPRTTRCKTPVIYPPGTAFPIGGSAVPRRSTEDAVTIVAAGITVHEARKAADALADEGITARVVDCYSVKPIDVETLRDAVGRDGSDRHGGGPLAGGRARRGGAVGAGRRGRAGTRRDARGARHARLRHPGAEQIDAAGISASRIAEAARRLAAG